MAKFCSKRSSSLPDLSMYNSTSNSREELPVSTTNKTPTSSTRIWSSLKDPRIVRVSRAFGGKDRHSKVTTIRGLRDRRVRLSVPTAIQLYDLQDRLGLSQPSKVVDWLLNAAQHEIDKLPPLEFPAVNFLQFHHDQNLKTHEEEEHQMEGHDQGSGNLINTAVNHDVGIGIYNAQSSLHQDHMPYHSSCSHWDSSNRNYFTQLGIVSSQVEMAPPPSVLSNYYVTAGPCDLEGRQLSHSQMGSSPQQNLSLNNNTVFRN